MDAKQSFPNKAASFLADLYVGANNFQGDALWEAYNDVIRLSAKEFLVSERYGRIKNKARKRELITQLETVDLLFELLTNFFNENGKELGGFYSTL